MGLVNGRNAFLLWWHLPDRPFRALVYMSIRSWDPGQEKNGEPPMEYWNGYAELAIALGLRRPHETMTPVTRNAVRRAIRRLEKAGAVTVLTQGKGAEYSRISLNLSLPPADPAKQ